MVKSSECSHFYFCLVINYCRINNNSSAVYACWNTKRNPAWFYTCSMNTTIYMWADVSDSLGCRRMQVIRTFHFLFVFWWALSITQLTLCAGERPTTTYVFVCAYIGTCQWSGICLSTSTIFLCYFPFFSSISNPENISTTWKYITFSKFSFLSSFQSNFRKVNGILTSKYLLNSERKICGQHVKYIIVGKFIEEKKVNYLFSSWNKSNIDSSGKIFFDSQFRFES